MKRVIPHGVGKCHEVTKGTAQYEVARSAGGISYGTPPTSPRPFPKPKRSHRRGEHPSPEPPLLEEVPVRAEESLSLP